MTGFSSIDQKMGKKMPYSWISTETLLPLMTQVDTQNQPVQFVCLIFYFLCLGIFLPACVSVHHAYARQKRALDPPRTRSTAINELPRGAWGLNSGPLKEQPVLLITDPSLQTHQKVFRTGYGGV